MGLCISAASHVALLGALIWYEVPFPSFETAFASLDRPLDLEVTWAEEEHTRDPAVAVTVAKPAANGAAAAEERPAAPAIEELRDFFGDDLRPAADDVGSFVRSSVDRAAKLASAQSEEDLLARLDQFGDKLGQISSQERMSDLSARFAGWLNTTERAVEPASKPVPGRFNIDSAQIHDVLREVDEAGEPRYVANLIDAEGRLERVPLTEYEGERLYSTFLIIKKHPLLEAVYRDVIMAFLDKLADGTSTL